LLSSGSSKKDYVYFQLGIVNTLLGENAKSQAYFRNVIEGYPSSDYVDNAVLQMAETSLEAGNYAPSIDGFTELINNYTQSPLVPYALVKRALAYSNLGEYEKSENDYKEVLNQYITHSSANSALLGLQELSAKKNIADFDSYLQKYQLANPDDESLETVEFEAAKTLYYNQLYAKAIDNFKKFQTNYPNSSLLSEANYYIADSYYRSGQENESVNYLKLVVADDRNPYQTRSLDRLADLLTTRKDYSEAAKYYRVLEGKSRNSRELGNAWEGIMTVYYEEGQYDSALSYANKILTRDRLSSDLKNGATLTSAKINVNKQNYTEAEDLFFTLVNGIKDENAAEANYELAKLYLKTERYKNALQTLFDLNKNFAQYDQWIGKSFLLIADIYMKQGELFQAKATLNSIIKNAEGEELKQQAAAKLAKLSRLEKEVVIEEKTPETTIDSLSNEGNDND
ncbi:MAG: tetratricopeptide repeat protein, partial [Cyclobacteriaceae bacterium]